MQASVSNYGEIAVVEISGVLTIEEAQAFRQVCAKHLLDKKVVFNMRAANFVGSNGIKPFLDIITEISQKGSHGLKVVNPKVEFRRIFFNMELSGLQIHESLDGAVASFTETSVSTSEASEG